MFASTTNTFYDTHSSNIMYSSRHNRCRIHQKDQLTAHSFQVGIALGDFFCSNPVFLCDLKFQIRTQNLVLIFFCPKQNSFNGTNLIFITASKQLPKANHENGRAGLDGVSRRVEVALWMEENIYGIKVKQNKNTDNFQASIVITVTLTYINS